MDTSFPSSYECKQLSQTLGSALPHYYFPGASTEGGRDGLLLEVRPEDGHAWIGTFAFGQITPKGVSGVFTTPDPQRLCVVSKGEGYLVSTTIPSAWEPIQIVPIIDVRPIRAQNILVFANYTELIAYGAGGIKWRTKRLTWDSLKITEVTDDFIKGEFWDIRNEVTANFVVDLKTGTHEGGIEEN